MSGPSAEGLPITAPSGGSRRDQRASALAQRMTRRRKPPVPAPSGAGEADVWAEARGEIGAIIAQADDGADMLDEIMAGPVAALVAAAREEGRREERERIADEIADRQHDELAGNIPAAGSTTQAYDYARRIARGQS